MEIILANLHSIELEKEGEGKKGSWSFVKAIMDLGGKNRYPVTFWNEDGYKVKNAEKGAQVKFSQMVRGREYEGKYYVDVSGTVISIGSATDASTGLPLIHT